MIRVTTSNDQRQTERVRQAQDRQVGRPSSAAGKAGEAIAGAVEAVVRAVVDRDSRRRR